MGEVATAPQSVTLFDFDGIDWSSQHKRLLRDAIFAEGMVMMTIPSEGWP